MKEYKIKFSNISFPYYIGNDSMDMFFEYLKSHEDVDTYIVITDNIVKELYAEKFCSELKELFPSHLFILESGEISKSMDFLTYLIKEIMQFRPTRNSCIIAYGGGVVGNVAGMVAGLLFRGVRFIHIPTTLMAISDSVISLKQGVNADCGKNLIGLYYKPEMVVTDTHFLKTLDKNHIKSGLCEVMKNCMAIVPEDKEKLNDMFNPECCYTHEDFTFFIDMSIKAKLKVMAEDPHEKKDGIVLEYGHTLGHAIEFFLNTNNIQNTHGECVGLGMLCAAEISNALGCLSDEDKEWHYRLFNRINILGYSVENFDINRIMHFLSFDNKRGYNQNKGDFINLVLLKSLGEPIINNGIRLLPVHIDVIVSGIRKCFNRIVMERKG